MTVEEAIDRLFRELALLRTDMHAGFDRLDARFDRFDERFDARLDGIRRQLTEVQTNIISAFNAKKSSGES